jgi:hypothetical protein
MAQHLEVRAVDLVAADSPSDANVCWWKADLTSIPETEVAFAGAKTVVMLAQAPRSGIRANPVADDLDVVIADTVARAAKRCGVERIVLYRAGVNDVREALLRQAGVPVAVLEGGGPEPVEHLAALVDAETPESLTTEEWAAPARNAIRRPQLVSSIQNYECPPSWSADDVANAYFQWLPKRVKTTRITREGDIFILRTLGVRALALRHVSGRSDSDSAYFEIAGGGLTGESHAGWLEFRWLLNRRRVVAVLRGYRPALPWPVYLMTQASAHERVMKEFGAWLATQSDNPLHPA